MKSKLKYIFSKKNTIKILIIAIIIIMFRGCIPVSVMHYSNLIFSPKDLFEPVLLETFDFYSNEAIRRFDFKPKYQGFYEISVHVKGDALPKNFKYTGCLLYTSPSPRDS